MSLSDACNVACTWRIESSNSMYVLTPSAASDNIGSVTVLSTPSPNLLILSPYLRSMSWRSARRLANSA